MKYSYKSETILWMNLINVYRFEWMKKRALSSNESASDVRSSRTDRAQLVLIELAKILLANNCKYYLWNCLYNNFFHSKIPNIGYLQEKLEDKLNDLIEKNSEQ
ncbi:hypothetical protein BpHYR1_041844 [Brachionus plicatilis]|uniref:Uncharacterized protein n=1 Tax=Brachionus plicatilis TaxID=10195 RepID=A0A3M7QAQ6_BRAPC|nr:hypothetical protein BpHYR1_041844 [Brachionus plicatilis]